MALRYPSYPVIPDPVNSLEMGLAGLVKGFQGARQGVMDDRSTDTLVAAGKRAGVFGGGTGALPLLSALGGQAAAGMGGSAPAPGTTTGGATPSEALTGDSGRIYGDFIGTVKAGDPALGLAGVTNPYGLAAVASTGRAESGYSPGNIHRQWSDPSESGKAGNAGGIMSWRAERLANMRAFASKVGDDPNRPSAATQAKFFLAEDPSLVAKLNAAQSPEEAQQLMNRAWAFAGYDRPGGEAARRTAMARSYYANEFGRGGASAAIEAQAPQRPVEVASIDPGAGMDTVLAYSPSQPQQGARRADPNPNRPVGRIPSQPGHVPTPTPRPEDQTYTIASATAPGAVEAAPSGPDPLMGIIQSVGIGQTSGLNLTEDEFRTLMRNPNTREMAMQLFKQKVTGDPAAQARAIDLALRLDERSYDRQRQAAQDAQAADEMTYNRSRDAVADQRWQQEYDQRSMGTVPAGYRRTTGGGLEYIPGGPNDPALERPDLETIYVDGREQKGYFDRNNQWVPVGDPKAPPSGSGGITIGPDGTVQIGGGPKLPANFMPDPENPGAVKPIPGGPGEQLPAELAGRIAIADSFLGQVPDIRKALESGAVTGWFDRFQAGNNASSDQAAIMRQMQSGADALQRLLTGAGMTETEAASYAMRYLPTYTDDAASAVAKLDQVAREVENARAAALRGRGGTGANVTPNGAGNPSDNDPLGLR